MNRPNERGGRAGYRSAAERLRLERGPKHFAQDAKLEGPCRRVLFERLDGDANVFTATELDHGDRIELALTRDSGHTRSAIVFGREAWIELLAEIADTGRDEWRVRRELSKCARCSGES